jgi:hypothetical protein
MRRLVLKMSISVDGFVCGPNGEIDWMMRNRDEGGKASMAEVLWRADVHAKPLAFLDEPFIATVGITCRRV